MKISVSLVVCTQYNLPMLSETWVSGWYPKRKTDVDKIERVQKRATKLIPELSKKSYSDRLKFLANVNSRSRSLYAVARPSVVCLSSVVCNARAPYSGGSTFRQYFYGIGYLGHPLTSNKNFTEIVPGEPLRRGS